MIRVARARFLAGLTALTACGGSGNGDGASKGSPDASTGSGADAAARDDVSTSDAGTSTSPEASDGARSTRDDASLGDAGLHGADAGGADAATSATPGARSGLPWTSGSNGDPTMESTYYDAFGSWRGRPDDVGMMYTDRSSWDSLTGAGMFVFSYMKTWPGKLVISQPPFPNDGSTLADCAAGMYDDHWKTFGSSLVSNSRADSIIRIAWEFNGDFMYWHATNDTTQFKDCWNHVAAAIKSTDAQVLLDWTINSKYTPTDSCNGDATNCYPGDTYVDYVGIDNYDEYPPSTTTSFDTIATAKGGITWIYDFAMAHQKRFSVGEWGVVSGAGSNGGKDNPAFVQNMFAWFQAHASKGLYECYFSYPMEVDSKIIDNTTGTCGCDNPMASAKYEALYHP